MLKENESKIKELDEKLKKSNMLVLLNKLKNETNSDDEKNNNEEKSNENGIVIYKSEYNKVGSNPDSIQEYFSNVISGFSGFLPFLEISLHEW